MALKKNHIDLVYRRSLLQTELHGQVLQHYQSAERLVIVYCKLNV